MKRYIKASRGGAQVGIWWYTDDGDVWARSVFTDDGVLDGPYIQLDDRENHMILWKTVVNEHMKSDADKIISKGYESLERGRVIYNTRTACYEVTCSRQLFRDLQFRKSIINYFELSGNQVEFIPLNHYYRMN